MFVRKLLMSVLFCVLAACGGGGGDSGDNPGNNIGNSDPVIYSGISTQAKITTGNFAEFTDNVLNADSSVSFASKVSPASADAGGELQKSSALDVSGLIKNLLPFLGLYRSVDNDQVSINATFSNEILDICSIGNATGSGTIDDTTGLGSVNVDFNNCNIVGETIDGEVVFTITAFNTAGLDSFSADLSFKRVSVLANGLDRLVDGAGSLSLNDNFGSSHLVINLTDMVVIDNLNNKEYKYENFSIDSLLTKALDTSIVRINGRLYNSGLGYIDVIQASFCYEFISVYPNCSAILNRMEITGDDSNILFDSDAVGTGITISIDDDGDNQYDREVDTFWDLIDDITDTDFVPIVI